MERLSWRREDIRSDLNKLPMIWRVVLGIIFIITTLFVMSLTEVFQVVHESWTYLLIAVIYAIAIFVILRFLRLKFLN